MGLVIASPISNSPINEVKEISIDEIVRRIYILESSGGRNDKKCGRLGKHNGYGYMQGEGRNFCLNSDDEVRLLVKDRIIELLKSYSLPETLCGYNLGFKSKHFQECLNQSDEYDYYKKFNLIK